MTLDDPKQSAFRNIESHGAEAIQLAKDVLSNPEPGYREYKTAKLMAEKLRRVGIDDFEEGIAITGMKVTLDTGRRGPTVAIIGELDSHIVRGHPYADHETDAAHACGHHTQLGMLLAAAIGLRARGVMDTLSGRVALMAIPAEEYIEIEYRDSLRREGKLEFLGGKPELIKLGEFDDINLAMMLHTTSTPDERQLCISGTNNGTVAKKIQFIGRGAHAGGAPHMGINALNAATLALSAIHYNRETFRDEDTVRVHPIITKGGEAVSAVPADVRMETFVRGRTMEAIMDANMKVDRALRAGAMAVGASVNIQTIPGYMPLKQNQSMNEQFWRNDATLVGEENVGRVVHRTGSTDMGDVSQIMPAIHPYVGGATGIGHGADYVVQDYNLAVLTAAKSMAATVIDMLGDGATEASKIVAEHRPEMTRNEYLTFMRNLAQEQTFEAK